MLRCLFVFDVDLYFACFLHVNRDVTYFTSISLRIKKDNVLFSSVLKYLFKRVCCLELISTFVCR